MYEPLLSVKEARQAAVAASWTLLDDDNATTLVAARSAERAEQHDVVVVVQRIFDTYSLPRFFHAGPGRPARSHTPPGHQLGRQRPGTPRHFLLPAHASVVSPHPTLFYRSSALSFPAISALTSSWILLISSSVSERSIERYAMR